jgi:hypothetical protein
MENSHMALESMMLPIAARRRLALDSLADLAQGNLAERLRLDLAARILGTARRVAELAAAGELAAIGAPKAVLGWDSAATTAREHAEVMTPAEIDALLVDAPRWASALLAGQGLAQRLAA